MDSFTQEIYRWFLVNKRDLPWRETTDPYKIWISEIILQQTRVAQGASYYNRFINEFPTVFDLANASEDVVLKFWQGLGYYTRARNLHATAKIIANKYNGIFPNDFETILSLKGIGNYTAAAIASIAYNLPYAAVDGNIYRLLSRYFGISTPIDSEKGKAEIQKIAAGIIPSENTGFHNQAFMEFGALQCTPKSPKCNSCPLINSCFAGNKNLTGKFPVKSKKIRQTIRYFYFYFIESGNSVLLEKRTGNDIWRNLYQFPLLETEKELTDNEILSLEIPFRTDNKVNINSISATKKYILTHQTLFARVIHIETDLNGFSHPNFIRVNKEDIYKFAVPKLIEQYLKN